MSTNVPVQLSVPVRSALGVSWQALSISSGWDNLSEAICDGQEECDADEVSQQLEEANPGRANPTETDPNPLACWADRSVFGEETYCNPIVLMNGAVLDLFNRRDLLFDLRDLLCHLGHVGIFKLSAASLFK